MENIVGRKKLKQEKGATKGFSLLCNEFSLKKQRRDLLHLFLYCTSTWICAHVRLHVYPCISDNLSLGIQVDTRKNRYVPGKIDIILLRPSMNVGVSREEMGFRPPMSILKGWLFKGIYSLRLGMDHGLSVWETFFTWKFVSCEK